MLLATTSTAATVFGFAVLALLAAVAIWLYFVPTSLVRGREYAVRRKIFWLNLLLGWTVIGYFVVLRLAWRARYQGLVQALEAARGPRPGPGWRAPSRPAGLPGAGAVGGPSSVDAASEPLRPGPPVAGWYDDPLGEGERWWDGTTWTQAVRGRTS